MPHELEKRPTAELSADEAALMKEMPELDGIGQSLRHRHCSHRLSVPAQ